MCHKIEIEVKSVFPMIGEFFHHAGVYFMGKKQFSTSETGKLKGASRNYIYEKIYPTSVITLPGKQFKVWQVCSDNNRQKIQVMATISGHRIEISNEINAGFHISGVDKPSPDYTNYPLITLPVFFNTNDIMFCDHESISVGSFYIMSKDMLRFSLAGKYKKYLQELLEIYPKEIFWDD